MNIRSFFIKLTIPLEYVRSVHSTFAIHSFDPCKNFSWSFSFREKEPYDSARFALGKISYRYFSQKRTLRVKLCDRRCLLGSGDPSLSVSVSNFWKKNSHSQTVLLLSGYASYNHLFVEKSTGEFTYIHVIYNIIQENLNLK